MHFIQSSTYELPVLYYRTRCYIEDTWVWLPGKISRSTHQGSEGLGRLQ